MNHYVYRINNLTNQKFYIGVRSCFCSPEQDLGQKYFSSSRDKEFLIDQKKNPKNYSYHILKIYKTRQEALSFEQEIQIEFDVIKNPRAINRSIQKTTGFDVTGYKHTLETKAKISRASKIANENIKKDVVKFEEKRNRCRNAQLAISSDPIRSKEVSDKKKKAWQNLKRDTKKYMERNQKISKKMKENYSGINHSRIKPIVQLDINTKKIIAKWDYIKQASESLKIDRSCISAATRGRQNTAGGYIWKTLHMIKGPQWK